jgi:hypothetical protein
MLETLYPTLDTGSEALPNAKQHGKSFVRLGQGSRHAGTQPRHCHIQIASWLSSMSAGASSMTRCNGSFSIGLAAGGVTDHFAGRELA